MAMYFPSSPTLEETEKSFNEAATLGRLYLLQLSEVCSDVLVVREDTFYRSVSEQSEIVPLLKSCNPASYYGISISLTGIFDLKAGFKEQLPMVEKNLETVLSAETKQALAQYDAEHLYALKVGAWNARPWYQRLFIPKPVFQELVQN